MLVQGVLFGRSTYEYANAREALAYWQDRQDNALYRHFRGAYAVSMLQDYHYSPQAGWRCLNSDEIAALARSLDLDTDAEEEASFGPGNPAEYGDNT